MEKHLSISPKGQYALIKPFKFLVLSVLAATTGAAVRAYLPHPWLVYPFFAIGACFLAAYIYHFALIKSITYKISKEQIQYVRGVFTIRTDYLELYRVKDLSLKRTFLMRLIRAMSLTLETSDRSHPTFDMDGIPRSNIDGALRDLVENARVRKGVREFD